MSAAERAYLDHAATSPMRPAAAAAYAEALGVIGNPASLHAHGQAAARMLATARERIAQSLGCDPVELVLTSGGTESVNLAIKGLYWARSGDDPALRGIVSARAEHHATLDAISWLARRQGARPAWAEVDEHAVLRVEHAAQLLAGGGIALVSAMHANNETGAVQPVRSLAAFAREHGVPLHIDAVASFGSVPVSLREWGAAAVSVSAHKIGGPAGTGALAVARDAAPEALVHGGGQQRGLRSGTQDVAAAIAFAAAIDDAEREAEAERARIAALRDRLVAGVLAAGIGATLRGPQPDALLDDAGASVPARLPGNAHMTFSGCQGDSLLFLLDMAGVSASTGSACQAGVAEPSHVLLAAGLDERSALGALRFTLGPGTSERDVDRVLAVLPDAVDRARRAGFSDRSPGAGSADRSPGDRPSGRSA